MSKEPEALRLADELEYLEITGGRDWFALTDHSKKQAELASAELRRLHKENQEFLNVLSWIADQVYDPWTNGAEAGRVAKFAVEKATGETQ